jgi:hypothetical protein
LLKIDFLNPEILVGFGSFERDLESNLLVGIILVEHYSSFLYPTIFTTPESTFLILG